MYLGDLPSWLKKISDQLFQDGLFSVMPDQAIINEYIPGQGIADHIDCTPCFGNVIASLSLGAPVIMNMKHEGQTVPIWLEKSSLLILQDEARSKWTHGIPRRKKDVVNNTTLKRGRRISITFRTVIIPAVGRPSS
jgi:alkylated DNA repair dioxygenase AlkB